MDKDADEIRSNIEVTRACLAATVEAIGYKADVPSRAKEAVADTVDHVKEAVATGVDAVKSAVAGGVDVAKSAAESAATIASEKWTVARNAVAEGAAKFADSMPTSEDLRAGADRANTLIHDNPVGIAVGAVAAGFLVGILLPRTSLEADRMRDVKQMAKDAGSQAFEAGKQMVRETVSMTFSTRGRAPDSGGL